VSYVKCEDLAPIKKREGTVKTIDEYFKIILILVILFLLILSVSIASFGQELTGEEIISKVNELMNQDTVQAKVKMTIVTSSGNERVFIYDSYSKNKGEKNLLRYIEPKRAKGQAILMLNYADDIWIYFPRTKRIRKLASQSKSQKMEGSDFSYEDTGASDAFIIDFTSKKLGSEKKEGYDCYKIEMIRKEGIESGYSRLIMWVIKDSFVPIAIDYYDRENPELLLKTLIQYDIKNVDGIPTATKMVMYNQQENSQTSIEMLEVKYNIELDDSLFTERYLKRR
jgi:outer membrane lipoprotein-sorting protein